MTRKDADCWREKDDYVSIKKKLTEGMGLFGGAPFDQDNLLWPDFKALKELRDDLVHFKIGSRAFYNTQELMTRTEKGARTAASVIKKIYLAHPKNTAYPPVFDRSP